MAKARVKIDGLYRLRFLVRWKEWEDMRNTWEPAGELEGSEQYWLFNNPENSCLVVRVQSSGSIVLALCLCPFMDSVLSAILFGTYVYINRHF